MNEIGIQNFTVVDQNYDQIQNIMGYQVFSPQILQNLNGSNTLVLVATHSKNFNSIREFIRSLNQKLTELYCGHSLLITLISSLCTYNSSSERL